MRQFENSILLSTILIGSALVSSSLARSPNPEAVPEFEAELTYLPQQPCQPSPCGAHSTCREFNGYPLCSCEENHIGSPPNCRPPVEKAAPTKVQADRERGDARILIPSKQVLQPSGDNSICRDNDNGLPVCSCEEGYRPIYIDGSIICYKK